MADPFGEGARLGLDCVATLPDGQALLLGWARAEAGAELVLEAGEDQPADASLIAHASFHPRPDLNAAGDNPPLGFLLLATQLPPACRLLLRSGRHVTALEVSEDAGDLTSALGTLPMEAGFTLLRDCAALPGLAPLLTRLPHPLGIFADWLTRLNPVRGKIPQNEPGLEEAESLLSLSGEVMVVIRGRAAFPPHAEMEALPFGLRTDATGRATAVSLPMRDWQVTVLPQAIIGHGHIDPGWADRLSVLDLAVRVQAWDSHWLRCRPRATTVPDLLDAVCRTTPFADTMPSAGAAALDQLRLLVARREAHFTPLLATLAAQRAAPDAAGHLPRLGLVLGADDPLAARLFQVTAAEFEGRCDRLLVMGEAAEDVAQVFQRRGRLPVAVGAAAVEALRTAAGRSGVLAVEAPRYAEAVARGRPGEAFSRPLGATDLVRLLALHGAAGCDPAISDTLARLLRLSRLRPGEPAFLPANQGWSSPHAAEVVNAHLARLWSIGLTEAATHG